MNLKKNSIFFISFFVYSGYYSVLALLVTLDLTDSTRDVTFPLRLFISIIMLLVLKYDFNKYKIFNKVSMIFITFWFIYFMKVLLHYSNGFTLNRFWIEYILYPINFCILPFLMFSCINFKVHNKHILNALIFSGFTMGLISLFLYKSLFSLGVGRISMAQYYDVEFETLNPLALSYAGALTLMLCAYELIYNNNKNLTYKLYLYTTVVLSILMFYLGSSRGSVIAIILTIPLLILYGNIKKKLKIFMFLLLSIPLIIYGSKKTGSSVFERLISTMEIGDFGRKNLWANAWNEFSNNPLLGGRIEIDIYPHNFVLEILMATGLLGFIFIAFVIIKGFINAYKKSFIDSNYIWVFIVLIQGIVQYSFSGSIYFAILLFFPLGLSYAKINKHV